MVLFTDGLVERPGASLEDAIDRLARSISGQQHSDAEALCDSILSDIDADGLRDDVALLVLRLPSVETPPTDDRTLLASSAGSQQPAS